MQASRYFLLLDNFSKKPDSRALIDNLFLTPLHKRRCHKLPPPCTHRLYCHGRPILLHRSHPPTSSWWYSTPAIIHGKRHGSFISLAIRVCKLVCLLGAELKKVQKTLPSTSGFVSSWYICCLTKLYHRGYSF